MNRILINDIFPNETRIALAGDGELLDFDLQSNEHFRTKSNIYKGVVTRIEPSLEAVFVNYGDYRNGFLPAKEIRSEYLSQPYRSKNTDLRELIEVGQELVVQVVKEARKDKGAALSTYLTISSRAVVMNLGYRDKVSISRNLSADDRKKMHKLMEKIDFPQGCAVILRTAAAAMSADEIKWDIDYLTRMRDKITELEEEIHEPALILQESDVITRTIRDRLNDGINEIIVDTEEAHAKVKDLVRQVYPKLEDSISYYQDDIPLFTRYGIEKKVQSAFKRVVNLSSGGQLVIDRAEAMFIIDVNSSQSTRGRSIEDTALTNNLEAVKEIATQMRIRDIGGLIVIDFIDMLNLQNKQLVEKALRQEFQKDKAYVRFGHISKFGIMELSRQRLRSSLDEFYLEKCPNCRGTGMILTAGAMMTNICRNVNEMVHNTLITSVECSLPPNLYENFNKIYSSQISKLEGLYPDKIMIRLDKDMSESNYKMTYTNVNGVTTEIDEHGDTINDESDDFYINDDVNRDALISADSLLNEAKPNKVSFLRKLLSGIMAMFTTSTKKKRRKPYKGKRNQKRGRSRNNYRKNYRDRSGDRDSRSSRGSRDNRRRNHRYSSRNSSSRNRRTQNKR